MLEQPSRRAFLAGSLGAVAGACAGVRPAATVTVPLCYDATGTLMIEARLGDGAPRRFVLDTGAERSALAASEAARLALPLRDGGEVEGTAGVVRSRAAPAKVAIAGIEPFGVDFTVYELAFADPQCVGILGAELLRRAPFALRYRSGELLWNAPAPAATLPLAFDHGIPIVAVEVGDAQLPLRLDTGASLPPGAEFYVNLTQREAQRLGLDGRPVAVWSATGTGGARLDLPVHRLPSLRIGGRVLTPAFAIVQPPVGYFARQDAIGFLGNAVLDKLDPFVDYRGRRFGITAA